MAKPLTLPLPPDLYLWDGCVISVTALDATTGNTVSGVDVSNVAFEVEQIAGSANALLSGPFMMVPGPGA